ncbi:hypothetical protein Taro_046402 [Colocasia esculenta]|uniref:RING-type E3 ubiquitin transferase n=1 Tax=Colocasia esculenta TaxID=4460 RepID=A0A843WYT6_COLES|nr:hypothetical protein [Colocasia esculenta]
MRGRDRGREGRRTLTAVHSAVESPELPRRGAAASARVRRRCIRKGPTTGRRLAGRALATLAEMTRGGRRQGRRRGPTDGGISNLDEKIWGKTGERESPARRRNPDQLCASASMSQERDHGHGLENMPSGNMGERATVFPTSPSAPRSYALSGKIMLSAIVILFTVVLLILCLHVYARWYLLRRARLRRRSRRRLVFAAEHQANAAATRGLDPEVIRSLPVFTYSAAKYAAESNESVECAVCLSDFQDNEKVRRLPRCKHSFHIECIDMWFHSHATCPLCRSTVELESPLPVSESVHIRMEAPAPPELCDSCRCEDQGATAAPQTGGSSSSLSSCSSSRSWGCGTLNRIEVPPRRGTDGFRSVEEEVGSPGVAQGLKSPMSRMASFKRILSFDLRLYRGGCSSNEPDLERGGAADAGEQQTPRAPAPQPQR